MPPKIAADGEALHTEKKYQVGAMRNAEHTGGAAAAVMMLARL
jgi:hypothetical protein